MTIPLRTAIRLSLRALAFASGLCALSLLLLPLMLALLMLLFDNTAQGVMVLLGSIAGWFQGALPGGGAALPAYRSLSLDPAAIALAAFGRMAPCLAGLVVTLLLPARRLAWAAAALLWLAAILLDGWLVAAVLLPGAAASLLLACGLGSVDAAGQRPA